MPIPPMITLAAVRGCLSLMALGLMLFGALPGAERLVILAEDDAAPWSCKDGTGLANDIVKAAFAAGGVDIDLQVLPYERAKQQVVKGTAVACFSMSWQPEYEGKIAFAEQPLFVCETDYFQNLGRPMTYRREGEIAAKIVVGTVVGYEYPPSVRQLEDKGLIAIEESPSEELNLRKLAAGRIDAALINHDAFKTADFLIDRAKVAGKVGLAFHCGELGSFIGFSQTNPRGQWARERFDAGHRAIAANGQLKQIEGHWHDTLGAGSAGVHDQPTVPGK
jgi:polar amino acid transport system substrate-binding protein